MKRKLVIKLHYAQLIVYSWPVGYPLLEIKPVCPRAQLVNKMSNYKLAKP